MKPVRAFLFLLSVLTLFISVSLFIERSRTGTLATGTTDILAEQVETPDDTTTLFPGDSLRLYSDTLPIAGTATLPAKEDSIAPGPALSDSVGFHHFTEKLNRLDTAQQPVRILYFGDSQIEIDRITSTLRKKLQQQFGGRGPGLIPLDLYYNPPHQLIMNRSDNWQVKNFLDKDITNQSILFRNSILTAQDGVGWFRINRIRSMEPLPDFNKLRIFYLANDSCHLILKVDGENIADEMLPGTSRVEELDFNFTKTPNDLKANFVPNDSLTILGLSLDSGSGIFVDNIALRGLVYPAFTRSDKEALHEMLDLVNPSLVVFQFGVNLVPYKSEQYPNFRYHFKRQIEFLKASLPEVPILIVGVSDMARKENGEFVSYPNIPQIKAIQREIAAETGSDFWDLEAFMGGPGSMISWVDANPPLGRKDYTHFTAGGANKIGTELSRLILEGETKLAAEK